MILIKGKVRKRSDLEYWSDSKEFLFKVFQVCHFFTVNCVIFLQTAINSPTSEKQIPLNICSTLY